MSWVDCFEAAPAGVTVAEIREALAAHREASERVDADNETTKPVSN